EHLVVLVGELGEPEVLTGLASHLEVVTDRDLGGEVAARAVDEVAVGGVVTLEVGTGAGGRDDRAVEATRGVDSGDHSPRGHRLPVQGRGVPGALDLGDGPLLVPWRVGGLGARVGGLGAWVSGLGAWVGGLGVGLLAVGGALRGGLVGGREVSEVVVVVAAV